MLTTKRRPWSGRAVMRRDARRDPDGMVRAARYNSHLKRTVPRRPGDATDFRTQPAVAPGGPVERIFPDGGAMPEPATVNQPIQEEPVTQPRVIPADEAQKPAIARLLLANADQRGWVGIEPTAIADRTGFSMHDVVHAIWDFQKQGYIKFRETKVGKDVVLTALRLTSSGRRTFTIRAQSSAGWPTETTIEPDGGHTETSPEWAVGEHTRVTAPEEPYPLTAALMRRKADLEEAAALLERAGTTELALAAIEAAQDANLYSPLEAEAIRLYERVAALTAE